MYQGVALDDFLDHLRHLFEQCGGVTGRGDSLAPDERGRAGDELHELSSRGLRVICSHDGADDRNAIQGLMGSAGLVENALDIGSVDSTNGDSSNIAARLRDGLKNGLGAGCTNDGLGVGFPALVSYAHFFKTIWGRTSE